MNNLDAGVPFWHDRLLTLALAWREQHPGFTFNFRKSEITGQSRLPRGFWFTGSEKYLFFPPYRPGDSDNKTKTIGFVIQFDGQQRPKRCYFELVFGNLEDPGLLAVHQQLRDSFEMQQVGSKQIYRHDYPLEDIEAAFKRFLAHELPRVRQVIDAAGLADRFLVSESKFDEMLMRILAIRSSRSVGSPDRSLCLLGTWKGLDEGLVAELQAKIARNGAWSSDWSFKLKPEARDLLPRPFHVYLNVGGNRIRYRLSVEDYRVAARQRGLWPARGPRSPMRTAWMPESRSTASSSRCALASRSRQWSVCLTI
jgi:hypothetical protein